MLWFTVTFAPLRIVSGTHGVLCVLYETFFFSWRYDPHWGLYFTAL